MRHAQAASAFATAQAEVAAENVAAFAEVAKKVQMDTVELMMAAGKDISVKAEKAASSTTSKRAAK